MSYDTWKADVPDTDDCTEDPRSCDCPCCRAYRDRIETNAEGSTLDDALGLRGEIQQDVEAARELKR